MWWCAGEAERYCEDASQLRRSSVKGTIASNLQCRRPVSSARRTPSSAASSSRLSNLGSEAGLRLLVEQASLHLAGVSCVSDL